MPMGQVPVLNYKGQELIQSLTIARFAARKCGLVGKTEIDEFLADQVLTVWFPSQFCPNSIQMIYT